MALDIDRHIRRGNVRRYLLQCALAGIAVLIVLLVLDAANQTVLIAALGASAFTAFAMPRSRHADAKHLIGGYVVGIAAGSLLAFLNSLLSFSDPIIENAMMILCGGIAISLAMFGMVATRTEHPPAAALALGIVINEWNLLALGVVLSGIVALTLIKQLVLPILLDLV